MVDRTNRRRGDRPGCGPGMLPLIPKFPIRVSNPWPEDVRASAILVMDAGSCAMGSVSQILPAGFSRSFLSFHQGRTPLLVIRLDRGCRASATHPMEPHQMVLSSRRNQFATRASDEPLCTGRTVAATDSLLTRCWVNRVGGVGRRRWPWC